MRIEGRTITRAVIVDDDPEARGSYEYVLEDLELETQPFEGPVNSVAAFIKIIKPTDVLLCDYHLKKRSYAVCDGDELIAACYKERIPGVLCTTFPDAAPRRDCLRYIPGVIKSGSLEPEDLVSSWKRCLRELDGSFEPSRRPWRTLVRVAEVDEERDYVYVIVPPWSVRDKIRIDGESLPSTIRDLVEPDRRFHAMVNTGASSHEDLFFEDWEAE